MMRKKKKDSEEKILGSLVHPPLDTQTPLSLSTLMSNAVCAKMRTPDGFEGGTVWMFM